MRNKDRVLVRCANPSDVGEAARVLHQVLGTSISEVRRAAAAGEPVATIPIWGNDHEDCAASLRAIIATSGVFAFQLVAIGRGGVEVVSNETSQDILDRLTFYDEL